jgi:hypothetical protein
MKRNDQERSVATPQRAEVSESRRRFSRLGLGAPVVMSLVSRPVFGAQCLSNMMSGNLSDPTRGTCSKGWSPGGWKQPGGTISNYSTVGAWSAAGYSYGTLIAGANPAHISSYTGGTKTNDAPFSTLLSGVTTVEPLRLYLKHNPGSLNSGIITAYLNAKLSAAIPGTFHYALTPAQVQGLVNGTIPLPSGYGSLQSFFYSTW